MDMKQLTFGKRLKALRKQREMTQEELAGAVLVTPRTIINYESDRCQPQVSKVLALSERLRVSPNYLLRGAD